jgi:flagellar FliJ protein
MHKFTFRLQSLLDIRAHQEDQRRMELGGVVSRKAQVEEELRKRDESRRTLLRESYGVADTSYIHLRQQQANYAQRLEVEMHLLKDEIARLESERLEAVDRYKEARKRASALEKLRDRRYQSYHMLNKREEQSRLDDAAINLRRERGAI